MPHDSVKFTVELKIVTVVQVRAFDEIEAETEALKKLRLEKKDVMRVSDIRVTSRDKKYEVDSGWYVADVDRLVDATP